MKRAFAGFALARIGAATLAQARAAPPPLGGVRQGPAKPAPAP